MGEDRVTAALRTDGPPRLLRLAESAGFRATARQALATARWAGIRI